MLRYRWSLSKFRRENGEEVGGRKEVSWGKRRSWRRKVSESRFAHSNFDTKFFCVSLCTVQLLAQEKGHFLLQSGQVNETSTSLQKMVSEAHAYDGWMMFLCCSWWRNTGICGTRAVDESNLETKSYGLLWSLYDHAWHFTKFEAS